jgi:hypothetical protein
MDLVAGLSVWLTESICTIDMDARELEIPYTTAIGACVDGGNGLRLLRGGYKAVNLGMSAGMASLQYEGFL